MFTSGKRNSVIALGIVGLFGGMALTLGSASIGQTVDIWRKDASNIIRTYPTNLQVVTGVQTETGITSTTTDASVALTGTEFDTERVVEVTPNLTGLTLSLTASTSLPSSFVPNAGECRQLRISNATSTAGASITLAGGTGSLLKNASTSAAVLPGGAADLVACRKADTDVLWSMVNTI